MAARYSEQLRRHPLCPNCGYNLVATVDANLRRCPECGYKFTMGELRRAPREGDWTPARGLQRMLLALLLRSLILLPLWAVTYGLIAWIVALVPAPGWRAGGIIIVVFIVFLPGLIIGKVISKNLTEIAGMVSPLISLLASLCAIVVAYGGPLLAQALHPVSFWHASLSGFLASGVALIFTIKDTLVDA